MEKSQESEVDLNFEAFNTLLPSLIMKERGKFALLHRQHVVRLFDNSVAAFMAGMQQFGEGRYSVQEIADQPDNLGFYSYAGGSVQA